MADYYTLATVQPDIPANLLDESTRQRLEDCGLTCELTPTGWYLYIEESTGCDSDGVDFEYILQTVVAQSAGLLPSLIVAGALTCSKPRPGEFGGFAMIITANDILSTSTNMWLMRYVSAVVSQDPLQILEATLIDVLRHLEEANSYAEALGVLGESLGKLEATVEELLATTRHNLVHQKTRERRKNTRE